MYLLGPPGVPKACEERENDTLEKVHLGTAIVLCTERRGSHLRENNRHQCMFGPPRDLPLTQIQLQRFATSSTCRTKMHHATGLRFTIASIDLGGTGDLSVMLGAASESHPSRATYV